MRIEINLKVFIAIILFLIIKNLENYLIFMAFIILHEFSHLLVRIIVGGKPKSFNINPFGASIEFYSYGKNNFFHKIFFYLSGPILNLALAILFYYLEIGNNRLKIVYINIALCFFNLLPILPLDGGNIIKEIFIKVYNYEKGLEKALIISKFSLFIISFLYGIIIIKVKNIYILFLILYLWKLYYIQEKRYQVLKCCLNR